MLVFFAIFPPKKISDKIDEIRKRYDGNFERLAPHITLIPPFVPKAAMEKCLKKLQNQLDKANSFEIKLSGIGCFKKRLNNVIYIDMTNKEDLARFQEEMFKILEPCGAKRSEHKGNNFHITIAKRLRPLRFKKIYNEICDIKFEEKFTLSEVTCCVIEKNEPWREKQKIKLG